MIATDAGGAPSDGSPVSLSEMLPTGPSGEPLVTVQRVRLLRSSNANTLRSSHYGIDDQLIEECPTVPVQGVVRCAYEGAVTPDDALIMKVDVTLTAPVAEGAQLTTTASVSGGGAPPVTVVSHNAVDATQAPFGPARFEFFKAGLNGLQETQAGGHPYELTTTIDLNDTLRDEPGAPIGREDPLAASVQYVRDIVVDLPLGLAGSTLATPQCTEAQLGSIAHCPPDTVVGHLTTEPLAGPFGGTTINGPIWNVVPEQGHPAEFGYVDILKGAHIAGYVSVVPTPQGYVLRFVSSEIPEVTLHRITVTFFGDPALRDAQTQQAQLEKELRAPVPLQTPVRQVPFFTNPTACSNGPQVARLWMDSWNDPGGWTENGKPTQAANGPSSEPVLPNPGEESNWKEAVSESPQVTGCNLLAFTPELQAQPTTHEADKPTGLNFALKLPQTETVSVPATPALKNIRVTFPAGLTVNPSSADGLGVCTNAQIGYEGPTLFDFSQAPPACPESSKIGELELESPDIQGVLHGEMFLAAQDENPFHSTFATYVVVNDPATGVVLKIAGELKLDPSTGQITSVFNENPQLPFSSLKLHFFGGPRAALATPANCGVYQTNGELEPWSFEKGDPFSQPFDDFVINEDCPTGFNPTFTAGSTNLAAGAFTNLQVSFERQDNEPELSGATVSLPPGSLANVAGVPECGETEIHETEATGVEHCPADTQVGTTRAGAGPGPNPLFVPGKVYFTGAYKGGPFGLLVVVPADPGPFNFGLVTVRQSLHINPTTAAVTDVSDPFPTVLDPKAPNGEVNGIPIKLRRVDVEINRPGFTFNPTNCAHLSVGGAISSTSGESKTLASPFQVTNCAHLKFAPKFTASTTGKTSKALGSSLTTRVVIPPGPAGTYANIAKVKVELPKQLPSQLKTLQKSCRAAVFAANPAACPKESIVGHATVHTPVLNDPLTGPAYFVSHAGEEFPNLIIVLQGDNVTINLVGDTFINKAGITSTTFNATPDTPFSTFELTLPQGEFAALGANLPTGANHSFCGQKLIMPVSFTAQNGAQLNQNTPITITGCPKTATTAQKLTAALKACHHDKNKTKRTRCERAARKRYATKGFKTTKRTK